MHRSKILVIIILFSCSLLKISNLQAELLINPAIKSSVEGTQVSVYYGTSSITYKDSDFGGKGDIDRSFLGVTAAYGASPTVDLFGAFLLITSAEIENSPTDDSGKAIAFGARFLIPAKGGTTLRGYVQFLKIDEDYGSEIGFFGDTISLSNKEKTLSAGLVVTKKADDIEMYGGVELVLMTDADITENDSRFGTSTFSLERDDTLGIRLGARIDAGDMDIDVSSVLGHESGIMIGITQSL